MTQIQTAHRPEAIAHDAVSARAWKVLALVSASMFVIILDNNAVNVAFPFIERTFDDTPRSTLAWVSSGYAICAAALLLVAGRLADRHGRRRMFCIGMAIFVAASALTAAAPNPALLISARLVQGAGAALLYSTAVALILPEFPPSKRGLALGIWGTVGSAGAAAGPTLGALAIEAAGWRLVFLLNLPIGVAALVLGPRVLQESRATDSSGPDRRRLHRGRHRRHRAVHPGHPAGTALGVDQRGGGGNAGGVGRARRRHGVALLPHHVPAARPPAVP